MGVCRLFRDVGFAVGVTATPWRSTAIVRLRMQGSRDPQVVAGRGKI